MNELFDKFSQTDYTHDTIPQVEKEHTAPQKPPGVPFQPLPHPACPHKAVLITNPTEEHVCLLVQGTDPLCPLLLSL